MDPADPARAPLGPPSPVPTPGETGYEYRNRVMDAEMAYRQGLTGEQLLATRSAGATATRVAMGSMRSLPETFADSGSASVFSFADPQRGWIVAGGAGRQQALLATIDGGQRWTKVRDLDFSAYDLEFVSTTKGWAATAQGLFTTDDGGHTWRALAEALPAVPTVATAPVSSVTLGGDRLQRIDFVDLQHGWGARWVPWTRTLALVRTTDGGASWTSLPDPCPPTGPVSTSDDISAHNFKGIGLFSVTSASTGWVFCRGEPDPHLRGYPKHLFHTGDAGQTWQLAAAVVPPAVTPGPSPTWSSTPRPIPVPVPPSALPLLEWPEDLFFWDDRLGWIGTARGSVYATRDGGRTWTEIAGGESPLALKEFRQLHFVSPTQGYTYYRRRGGGALLETRDGGRTWTQLHPPDTSV